MNDQLWLNGLFANQTYGPHNGFEPREFQVRCLHDYREFLKAPVVFGRERKAFVIYGGTGCGKTKLAGLLDSHLLNIHEAQQVIVVVPNNSIRRKTRDDFLKFFGIDLAVFNSNKHQNGIPRLQDGYVLNYNSLMNDPTTHRRLCKGVKTVVNFDEIHHLGAHPESAWGAKSIEAFSEAAHLIGLTGTPYRLEGGMPFVEHESTAKNGILRFKANFTYSLGRAVADGVCRKPSFQFHYGKVKMRDVQGNESVVSFDDEISDPQLRLRGAVAYGSSIRKDFLRRALTECREDKRKVIIFLGGDTCGEQSPIEDATGCLPVELLELGHGADQVEIVTGYDSTAQKRIEDFHRHPTKWILVSINMVSEGTDIPPISAAIFLTSVTAKQTTVQRIGRALRLMEDDPHTTALIFMFADPVLKELAGEIEDEIKAEISLKRKREAEGGGGGGGGQRRRPEAIGVGEAPLQCVIFNGREFPAEVVERARQKRRELGLPTTFDKVIASLLMGE